jgi:hypothetical protein
MLTNLAQPTILKKPHPFSHTSGFPGHKGLGLGLGLQSLAASAATPTEILASIDGAIVYT